jgi:hypothetical protein
VRLLRPSIIVLSSALLLAGAAGSPSLAQPAAKPTAPAPPPPRVLGAELWRGARVGMAQEDVAKLFPEAAASSGELLPRGGRSALKLSTPIAGANANVQFYFDADGGLETVIVDRPDVSAHQTEQNLAKAHAVADALAGQFGKAPDCSEQRRMAALTCTWSLGEAKAILSYRDIGGAAPSLSVTYRKAKDTPPWAPRAVRKLKSR